MKARDALIAWTPVYWKGHHPDLVGKILVAKNDERGVIDWSRGHSHTGGACYSDVNQARGLASSLRLFIDFNTIVTRDGLDPIAVHLAFLAIDEYCDHIAPDLPTAAAIKLAQTTP